MPTEVSGGPEFESDIQFRHLRFTFTAAQAAASSRSRYSGRPVATDAARRTRSGGLPGVMQRQEPYKSNQFYIKMLRIAHQTR